MKRIVLAGLLLVSGNAFSKKIVEAKCFMPHFYFSSGYKMKISPENAPILQEKGYTLMTAKEFRKEQNKHFINKTVFVLSTVNLHPVSNELFYYEKGTFDSLSSIRELGYIQPRPRTVIMASENRPIQDKLVKLEIDLLKADQVSEIEAIKKEIEYWKTRYNHSLDRVVPKQTNENALLEKVPNCSEVY